MTSLDEDARPVSPSPSQLPPVPSSPVYSIASTANPISQYNLPVPPAPRPAHAILTKNDLANSQQAYSDLLASAKAYRQALASISTAASEFGSALEACARLKESRAEPLGPSSGASLAASFTTKGACTADNLLATAGVHHLVANHHQILSETVYRSFEVPLLHDLDRWQAVIDDEEDTYQQKIKTQAKEVKRLEKEGMKLHKQKRRDVARFRAHLVELTSKLDGLTTLHGDHARTMLRESQETSSRIVDASCSLVRAEVDIFESLAKKGWSGGGLEDILEKGQDLFATDLASGQGASGSDGVKLFSILPPKSILADTGSEGPRPNHGRSDSLLVDTERYQSLSAVASDVKPGDAENAYSTDFNKPRNARPFSPQPIRRIPVDVTIDSLGAAAALAGDQDGAAQQNQQDDNETSEEQPEVRQEVDTQDGSENTVPADTVANMYAPDPEPIKTDQGDKDADEDDDDRGRMWPDTPVQREEYDSMPEEAESDNIWRRK
ncbi:Putative Phospholipid-binding protein [[Torrubiella] hemipterigena]|uniref:Putative Phospholipid-binding protein n=1 Tax=[Torrubiella] hemipterigena TaxID=1531966 RepID=A0A0A1T7S0_9HYPO|nr:Putative Phospholipid-binding protein [[Torrubiella] hemipterigena]